MDLRKKRTLKRMLITILTLLITLAIVLVSIFFATRIEVETYLEIPLETDLTNCAEYVTVDKTSSYLGHPDLVRYADGTYACFYPSGHGKGSIIQKTSSDGLHWSERATELPDSWVNSQETPTVYRLNFTDGSEKLVLISGCPKWPATKYKADGFNFSYSNDDGKTWSEFEKFYSPFDCIVAMSSLTRIKVDGEYIDKWMGTFHTHAFINYKTYLTFVDGSPVWSHPEPLFNNAHHPVEQEAQLCETEVIRVGDALVAIARANARKTRSMITASKDEGLTWSPLTELPYYLTGDRHKAEYDADGETILLSFRQAIPHKKNALSVHKFTSVGWVAWVGNASTLLAYAQGDFTETGRLFLVAKDYSGKGDCGYSGTDNSDGLFTLTSYGRFDKKANKPYILAVQFRLSDLK